MADKSESVGESEVEVHLEHLETEDFNLGISVAVTEAEGTDLEGEFDEALSEIHGEKSFPCPLCDKVCKSKGGLTRHTNSKHKEGSEIGTSPEDELFCLDSLSSIVESIKTKITEEKLYGEEVTASVKKASCSEDFYRAILPMYKRFCKKKNQDELVESFFGLMTQSSKLLNCEDYKAANLIMIHVPDHLVGFYNINRRRQRAETSDDCGSNDHLDQAEYGPLTYIAGYVVSKLFQQNKRKSGSTKEEVNLLLQCMKSSDNGTGFIAARTRGGLINPSADLVRILEVAEISFRMHVAQSKQALRNIPTKDICNTTLESPLVKSLWENITLSAGVDNTSTKKLCLESVIYLYLKVRSFSYARDYLTKHKIKEKKTKQKALRKDLKRSADEPM
jgi:hypothetical protein